MSDLTYEEALRALQDRGRFGIRLGLGRTRALLRELGDPQRSFRGALVAGTNGKGSVLALAGSALRAAGYRVAETPKPHLVSYRERLQIGGRLVDPTTFARLVGEVVDAAGRISRRSDRRPSSSCLTAVAFRWFAESDVDLAMVEVGPRRPARRDPRLGWRRRRDHQRRSRSHRPARRRRSTAIAREKAAIIERGDLAVTGATGDALGVIRRRARRLGVPLTEVVPPPRSSAGTGTGSSSTWPGWARPGSACAAGTRRPTRPWPTRVLDALDAAGIATVPAEPGGAASPRHAGRAGSS